MGVTSCHLLYFHSSSYYHFGVGPGKGHEVYEVTLQVHKLSLVHLTYAHMSPTYCCFHHCR